MNQHIKEILSQVYELEGLLLLVENHKESTDNFVYELIRKKGETINSLTEIITPEIHSEPSSSIDDMHISETKDEVIDSVQNQEFEMLGADTCCDVDDESEDSFETSAQIEEETIQLDNNDVSEIEEEESFIDNDADEIEVDSCNESESVEDDETMEIEAESENLSDDEYDEIDTDDNSDEVEELLVDDSEDSEDDESKDNSVRLGDVLQQDISKNLKKAFTLNDRFRYRRELFENSDVQMTNTLNLVETMQSFSEAEDYFYNDLEWDSESEEVQDFMSIIKKHFA